MNLLPPDEAGRAIPADAATSGLPPAAGQPGFQEYIDRFLRRKWLALGIFLAVLGVTVLSVVRTPPVYEARATLLLKSADQSNVFAKSSFLWPTDPNKGNFIELLRSRTMAEYVSARLRDSLGLDLQPGYLQSIISARPMRESDVIQLVTTTGSKATAVATVNAYLEVSQQYDLEQNQTDVRTVKVFVDSQLFVVGTRLDSSEKVLAQFKASNRLADLGAGASALVNQQSGLAAAYQQTTIDAQANQAQLAYVEKQIAQEGAGMADKLEGISSPLVSNLKATLNQLEVQKANLMIQGFGETSERVQGLDRQIDSTRARLRTETQVLIAQQGFVDPVGHLSGLFESALLLRTELAASKARQEALAKALRSADADLARLPETERGLARLTREVETDRKVHELLSERREEARIQEVGRVSTVRIIDRSRGAYQTKPDVQSSVSFGLAIALAFALGAAWIADRLDSSIRSPEEMERRGYPVLAGIPQFSSVGARRGRRREELASHLLTHPGATSSDAEAYRILRTNLAFSAIDRPLRTIMITSAVPGEGKSTAAVNLATVLAQAGSRVLLVDADLRHPVLHGLFKQERKPGLTDLILSGESGEEVFFPTAIHPLFFLPAGTTPPSPSDLLIAPATRKLISRLAGQFDYVVIDTAPALIAADTPIIGSLVDATIMVVRAEKTPVQAVENARRALLNSGARLAGFVLNGIAPSSRYGSYYYKYHYYHQLADAVEPGVPGAPGGTADKRG